jgi:hypothetical protein
VQQVVTVLVLSLIKRMADSKLIDKTSKPWKQGFFYCYYLQAIKRYITSFSLADAFTPGCIFYLIRVLYLAGSGNKKSCQLV